MKKKILIRIGSLRHGGAEKVLVTFLKNLSPDKYEIDLLLNLYSGKYLKDVFPDKTLFSKEDKEKFIRKFVSSSRLNVIWGKCVRRDIVDSSADYSKFNDKKGENTAKEV